MGSSTTKAAAHRVVNETAQETTALRNVYLQVARELAVLYYTNRSFPGFS
jgi:hypothetical protein